jgi:tetratricopeptide (TPR) repeat protein
VGFLQDFLKKAKDTDRSSLDRDEDTVLLEAEPISRKRMDLLWLDPPHLVQVAQALAQHDVVKIELGFGSTRHEHEITREDHSWAKQVEKVVDKAFAAGQQGDYLQSVQFYKEALRMAPGCDLFLMSVGTSYAFLGQKTKSIQFLERAAQISPNNERIRENLEKARRL